MRCPMRRCKGWNVDVVARSKVDHPMLKITLSQEYSAPNALVDLPQPVSALYLISYIYTISKTGHLSKDVAKPEFSRK
jgi:hypothetical protein